jgi:hypothetical protein
MSLTPQTTSAASLCQFEAIVGQFFTTALIAWLVGNYVSDRRETQETTLKGDEEQSENSI